MANLIYDDDGIYTDQFNEFQNKVLEPIIGQLTDVLKKWLTEQNASCLERKLAWDYLLINDSILLVANSDWTGCIEQVFVDEIETSLAGGATFEDA